MTTSKAYSGIPAPSSLGGRGDRRLQLGGASARRLGGLGGGLDFRAHCAAHRGIYGLLGEFPRFVGHPEQEIKDYRRYTYIRKINR